MIVAMFINTLIFLFEMFNVSRETLKKEKQINVSRETLKINCKNIIYMILFQCTTNIS